MSLETAQATFEAVMRHLTETGNGIVLDWASVFQELGIGPGVMRRESGPRGRTRAGRPAPRLRRERDDGGIRPVYGGDERLCGLRHHPPRGNQRQLGRLY